MKKYTALFLMFSVLAVYAQNNQEYKYKDANFIDVKLHSGMVINNYIYFDSFPKRKPSALVEFKFGKQTTGSKNWQQFYGFPKVGISAIGGYLGNSKELGYMFGIMPDIVFNTLNENKWSMKIRTGFGFAYFNKPYDTITNFGNILVGSHFTTLVAIDLYFQRNITEKLNFKFGLSGIHASNGHTGLPNVGLNMININAGFNYYFDKKPTKFNRNQDFLPNKNLKYVIRFGLGTHKFGNELGPHDSPSYSIYDAAFYVGKPIGSLGSLYAGLGYKYYNSFYEKIIERNIFSENQHLKASEFTFLLAYEFEMGQLCFLTQGGLNIYKPFWADFVELVDEDLSLFKKIEGIITVRLGLQYYVFDKYKYNNNIFFGLYIKANMGAADFISFNTGFAF
jgi:hypothetical protein